MLLLPLLVTAAFRSHFTDITTRFSPLLADLPMFHHHPSSSCPTLSTPLAVVVPHRESPARAFFNSAKLYDRHLPYRAQPALRFPAREKHLYINLKIMTFSHPLVRTHSPPLTSSHSEAGVVGQRQAKWGKQSQAYACQRVTER